MDSVDTALPISLVNGELREYPALTDLGFQYGDGIFETMYCESGQIPLKTYHLDRLQSSCQRLKISVDIAELKSQLEQALSLFSETFGRVKLILTRGQGGATAYPPVEQSPNVYIQVHSLKKEQSVGALELVLAPHPLEISTLLAGIKHMNRLPYIVASLDASISPGQDLLFCDREKNIIETMRHNIFFIENEKIVTPSIQQLGVAGVMRRVVKEKLAPSMGMQVEEREIPLSSIGRFDECFISNAVRGLTPVTKIGEHLFPSVKVSPQLRQVMLRIGLTL